MPETNGKTSDFVNVVHQRKLGSVCSVQTVSFGLYPRQIPPCREKTSRLWQNMPHRGNFGKVVMCAVSKSQVFTGWVNGAMGLEGVLLEQGLRLMQALLPECGA